MKEVQTRLLGMLHSLAKEVQSRCEGFPEIPLQRPRFSHTMDTVSSGVGSALVDVMMCVCGAIFQGHCFSITSSSCVLC